MSGLVYSGAPSCANMVISQYSLPSHARGGAKSHWAVLVWMASLWGYTGRGVLPNGWAGIVAPAVVGLSFIWIVVLPAIMERRCAVATSRPALILAVLFGFWAIPMGFHWWDSDAAPHFEMWFRMLVKWVAGFMAAMCVVVLRDKARWGAGVSITIMACVAAGVLLVNRDVFWISEHQDTANRVEAAIASSVSLGLIFTMGFGVGAAMVRSNPALGGALLLLTTAGNAVCMQRFGIVIQPLIVLMFAGWRVGCLWCCVLAAVAMMSGLWFDDWPVIDPLIGYFGGVVDGGALTIRGDLMGSALVAFTESPCFGIGPGRWPAGEYPHSFVLQSFSDLGVLGGIASLVLALSVVYALWRFARQGASWPVHDRAFVAAATCGWLFSMKAGDLQSADVLVPLAAGVWGAGRVTTGRAAPMRPSACGWLGCRWLLNEWRPPSDGREQQG